MQHLGQKHGCWWQETLEDAMGPGWRRTARLRLLGQSLTKESEQLYCCSAAVRTHFMVACGKSASSELVRQHKCSSKIKKQPNSLIIQLSVKSARVIQSKDMC